MTVRTIRLAGDPTLRAKCDPIKNFNGEALLAADLRDTLLDFIKRNGLGHGIAAPQIGIKKRAIYVVTDDFEGEMLNPRIVSHSDKEFVSWDACFSFKAAIFVKVRRWEEVTMEYFTVEGGRRSLHADGLLSALLQHEVDHLDGILFVDRQVREGDHIIMREEWENLGSPFRI